jgi:hypothetical protein
MDCSPPIQIWIWIQLYVHNYKCTYGYIDVIYEEYVDGNLAIYCQFIRQCIKSIHGAKYGVIYRQ